MSFFAFRGRSYSSLFFPFRRELVWIRGKVLPSNSSLSVSFSFVYGAVVHAAGVLLDGPASDSTGSGLWSLSWVSVVVIGW